MLPLSLFMSWSIPVFHVLVSLSPLLFAVAPASSASSEDNILSVLLTCYYSNPLGDRWVPKSSDSSFFFYPGNPYSNRLLSAIMQQFVPIAWCSSAKFVRSTRDWVFSEYGRDLESLPVPKHFVPSVLNRRVHIYQENCSSKKLSLNSFDFPTTFLSIFLTCAAREDETKESNIRYFRGILKIGNKRILSDAESLWYILAYFALWNDVECINKRKHLLSELLFFAVLGTALLSSIFIVFYFYIKSNIYAMYTQTNESNIFHLCWEIT